MTVYFDQHLDVFYQIILLIRYQTLPHPVQWGIDHEKDALKDYLTLQNAVSDVTVEASGLTIYPTHAFLGATSDGWVNDKSMPVENQRGLLEIKCPYSISNKIIVEKEVIVYDFNICYHI